MKARLTSLLIRLLAATWRLRIFGEFPDTPFVCAFWHGTMLAAWKAFSSTTCAAVTSQSRDGDLLAQLLVDWNYDVIRGSSSQGGKDALEKMVSAVKHKTVLLTPDGPRGPACVMKPGAVICAQRAQVPFVFLEVRCIMAYHFNKSWDQFMLPLPFARVDILVSEAQHIESDLTREQTDDLLRDLNVQFSSH